MKKLIAIILALTMLICVAGCKESSQDNSSVSSGNLNSENDTDNKPSSDNNNFSQEGSSDKNSQGGTAQGGTSSSGSQGGSSNNGSSAGVVTKANIEINSLDKLNFFAVKKAIEESSSLTALSTTQQSGQVTNLSGNADYGLLNLANSTATSINANSSFTITMYSYFTVTISDANGFLAQKLGGTGTAEVVITENSFNNMITFKKGDRYYSCFEVSSNENARSFSTHKYVNGFKLVENYDQENYEFTVYFEGDRVIGINSGRYYSEKTSYKYKPDNITLKDKFSFVVYKKQTFTAEQLEKLFSNNNSFVDDGVVLADGTILFGESSATNIPVYFKNTSNKTVLTNSDIKKVSAMQNPKYGFCIKLELDDSGKISGNTDLNFYVKSSKVMKLTLQNDSGAVYITGFTSKSKMSDIFYKLTSLDTGDKIGRFITPEEFKTEISKKLNLDDYSLEIRDYSDTYNDGYNATHVYTLKEDKDLSYQPSNYEVTIDGISFSLPIKVSDLIAKGFRVKQKHFTDSVLAGGAEFESPEGNTFDTYIMNFYHNSTTFNNCYVTQILVDFYANTLKYQEGIRYTAPELDILYGINKNSTLDDIISRLGAPNTMHVYYTENKRSNYRDSHITLRFYFGTPTFPNADVNINIFPVTNNTTPSDFVLSISVSLQ